MALHHVVAAIVFAIAMYWIFEPVILYANKSSTSLVKARWIANKNSLFFVGNPSTTFDDHMYLSWKRKHPIELSIVVPAYNEESRITKMFDEMLQFLSTWAKEKGIDFEIIIVDDKSTDNTVAVVQSRMNLSDGNAVHLLQLGANRGKGGAIKAGIEFTRGRYILMADADGATRADELGNLYAAVKSDEKVLSLFNMSMGMGMAIGSRAHLAKNSIATRPLMRTVLMKGFHILVAFLCSKKVQDTQCGFKLFTRATAEILFRTLHIEGWAFDVELIYVAESLGVSIKEIDVSWTEVEGSKLITSKFDVLFTSLRMARDMLCVRLAYVLGLWKVVASV